MRRTSRTGRGRRGAGAAELAVVLPVLTLICLGCVDFGRFAYHYIAVQNAARTGAEYGITTPYSPTALAAWKSQIGSKAAAELEGQTGLVANAVTVTVPDPTVESTGLRRVRVGVAYTGFVTLVSWPGIPDNPTLRGSVEMRSIR